jgi:hypothetical protein
VPAAGRKLENDELRFCGTGGDPRAAVSGRLFYYRRVWERSLEADFAARTSGKLRNNGFPEIDD